MPFFSEGPGSDDVIRTESEGIDPVGMALEVGHETSRDGVPNLHRCIS